MYILQSQMANRSLTGMFHKILTRLPASESSFQRQTESAPTLFLSQAMDGDETFELSNFAHNIILLTIGGRCVLHHFQCNVKHEEADACMHSLMRLQHLSRVASQKMVGTACNRPHDMEDEQHEAPNDPATLFGNMIIQTNEMHLISALHAVLCRMDETSENFNRSIERALLAVQRMSILTEHVNRLGYFEVSKHCAQHRRTRRKC